MGGAKSELMEADERGWFSVSKWVCSDCVDDSFLKEVIQENVDSRTCDYCGIEREECIAAPVDIVLEVVFNTIHTYFSDPISAGVPYDGGLIIDPVYTHDVLNQLSIEVHPDLFDDICSVSSDSAWVAAAEGSWLGTHEHQNLLWGWDRFSNLVKHSNRYHFNIAPPVGDPDPRSVDSKNMDPYDVEILETDPGDVNPRNIPSLIGNHLQALLTKIPKGTAVYRCRRRKRNESWPPIAEELGAPNPQRARAGRMNPAGIPYLYTAFDAETVLHEVGAHKRTTDTIFMARFVLNTDVEVVDLTALPPEPSIFDVSRKCERERALFIKGFIEQIVKPVSKDGQEHIDYVPSQVVCEYLAQIFRPHTGSKLTGLIYPSSVYASGRNLVIFPSDRGLDGNQFKAVSFVGAFRYKKARQDTARTERAPYPKGKLIPI